MVHEICHLFLLGNHYSGNNTAETSLHSIRLLIFRFISSFQYVRFVETADPLQYQKPNRVAL